MYLEATNGSNGRAAAFTFETLLAAARDGDRHAVAALDSMAKYIGIGLAGLVSGLAPEAIVIVGEVTRAWDRVGPIIHDVVKQRALPSHGTRIVPADPAVQPRLRGAATLVVQQHFGAPAVG
jgi:predicted NBD/HSP70 family sugar kinase